jgi:hypothetical protein
MVSQAMMSETPLGKSSAGQIMRERISILSQCRSILIIDSLRGHGGSGNVFAERKSHLARIIY